MATLITNSQFKQFDADGKPLASGKIYTYIVGTTTNKVTYEDEALTTEHTNPIILDAWGEATIWIDGDTKFYVTDTNDAEIRTYPSFTDSGSPTGESPVVPSPGGAVLRSESTETGYIKIQLPMGEWPNTKMMFDVNIYTDSEDTDYKLTLSGYANSATDAWEETTVLTNGNSTVAVQFGNDGTYPAIYIGAVDTEWVKPQIAVSNFLAGQFSYDWDTWNDGWDISVTTSLGTITASPDTYGGFATEAETTTGTSELLKVNPLGVKAAVEGVKKWGIWVTPTYEDSWVTYDTSDARPLQFRLSTDGEDIQFVGSLFSGLSTSAIAFYLPVGYRPVEKIWDTASALLITDIKTIFIDTDGAVSINSFATGTFYSINRTIALT